VGAICDNAIERTVEGRVVRTLLLHPGRLERDYSFGKSSEQVMQNEIGVLTVKVLELLEEVIASTGLLVLAEDIVSLNSYTIAVYICR
jgi:hypothetical protein